MQKSFKVIEADYANKYNSFETKINMISTNYKKIKDKLTEIANKYRTLSLQVSNSKNKEPCNRILEIFNGEKEKMYECVLNMVKKYELEKQEMQKENS